MKKTTSILQNIRFRGLLAALAFFICLASTQSTTAATYTVTNTLDSGAGSLRQAVLDANGTAANDVIVFNIPAASCNATTGVCTITLTTTEIIVTNNGTLTINGTGANRLTISGGGARRIFYSNLATFTLSGATLTNGNGAGASNNGKGGAIYASGGTLVLRGVNVTNNTASSGGFGGGVIFDGGTNHQITNSTFSGNNGLVDCGGFWVGVATPLTMTNSTVSGNMATQPNGGFCSDGTMTVRNSTIANNTGGGFSMGGGTVNIGNSIVAGNTGGFANFAIFAGTLTSAGYNLIGNNANATTQFPAGNPNGNNDIVGTSGVPILPLLDALGNYGGTVPTRRLQTGSPAIDKGSAVAGVTSDGRGVIRPFDNPLITNAASGNGADIGAFELQTSLVRVFGYNIQGKLGLGDSTDRLVPTTLTGFNDITQFGGGFQFSSALRANGTVITAGINSSGELGDGTTGGANRPTFAQVTGANVVNIMQISGGDSHTVALRSDGTVWAWGNNNQGQLGNGNFTNSGTPVQVGASVAAFNTHVIAVSSSHGHTLALTDDGKVWAWGRNNEGQLGDGTTTNRNLPQPVLVSIGGAQLSGVIQVSAGGQHSVALTTTGAVFVWGQNDRGQVGNNTTSASVAFPTQTTATLMGTIVQISAGNAHTAAINTAGNVYAWGQGTQGEIGDNNTVNALVPRQTLNISNVVRIEAHASWHNLARQRDGNMFAWGHGAGGEIGDGAGVQRNLPVNISTGNLGTNVAVFGVGFLNSFTATLPEVATPAGASTLRGDNFSVAFPASTVAGTTQVRAFNPTATGLTVPTGYTIEANSTGYDFTTTATFPGTATVCLKVPNVISAATFSMLNILHDDDGDGTLDVAASTRNYQLREVCRAATSFSPFVLAQALVPLAATVSVSGRVSLADGRGLRNARVILTNADGNSRTAVTSTFGYYRFDEIEVGQTVIVSVASKQFGFAPKVLTINEAVADLDFIAQ